MALGDETLLTDDKGAAGADDAAAKATADAAAAKAAADAAVAAVPSVDDQRKALIDAGANADEIGKLDEAALKAKFDEKTAADKAKATAGAPEKYEAFKMPDGVQLEDATMAEFTTLAKELNLSQEKAQKLVDLHAKNTAGFSQKLTSTIETQIAQWVEQAKTDKEFGGDKFAENLAVAKLAMKDATPEMKTLLKESGIGNHPEIIRHFYRLGKLQSQDRTLPRGDGNKPGAQNFYANSKMNP